MYWFRNILNRYQMRVKKMIKNMSVELKTENVEKQGAKTIFQAPFFLQNIMTMSYLQRSIIRRDVPDRAIPPFVPPLLPTQRTHILKNVYIEPMRLIGQCLDYLIQAFSFISFPSA